MEDAVSFLKFKWKRKNFSKIRARIIYSDVVSQGTYTWRIKAYPKGCNVNDHLSVYLEVADSETLPSGWSRIAKFSLTLVNHIDNKSSRTYVVVNKIKFDAKRKKFGWPLFIPLKELHDPKKGYLVKDTCTIEAHVTHYEDASVESNNVSEEEPTTEDMNAFFGDLNSVIFPVKVVSSEEEATQALAMIEETLNMAPVDLNNSPGRMLQLKNTFEVLSSIGDGLTLTSEQKAELLSMKDNFIDLPKRAATAAKSIKRFTEKELVKTALDQKLGKCLIGFEKAKEETVQNEQNIATLKEQVNSLLAQIGESEKKKENSLLKQKEMYKLSKELKGEHDNLEKNWPEDEAKMKEAEDEENIVGTEWSKMKQFVLALKPQCSVAKKPVKRKLSTCYPCT